MFLSTFINFSLIYIEGPYRPKGSGFNLKIFGKNLNNKKQPNNKQYNWLASQDPSVCI